jgi:ATP-dependent RNA helicase HelY
VHYLADRFRGAVWEEVIIHLPESVQLAALSATVSNAEEFGDWLGTVRGTTEVIVDEIRPVPLWQHVMAGSRLYDLFVDDDQHEVNPELVRLARDELQRVRFGHQRPQRGGRRPRAYLEPSRVDMVERLDSEALLPAIVFIFSRAGCDAAVMQCARTALRLTTPEERDEITRIVEKRCSDIPEEDLAVLGYHDWYEGLLRGVASHHAGLLPAFKEVVEELFTRGLVKVTFATETLALGINMPARSVVLERLTKWNGESHVDITPGEYTQLTGRAGRRGIDVEGHAVVVWHHGLDPRSLAGLASTRTYPLRSSFRPSYNMAVNLVGQVGRDQAREILETSFAQFQADRAVVGLARQIRRNEEALDDYKSHMTCHLGDFQEYAALRRELSDREADLSRTAASRRRAAAHESLMALKVGDVILVPGGRRAGLAVVVDPGIAGEDARPTVLTVDRQVKRLSLVDFPTPVDAITRLRIPNSWSPRRPKDRNDLAAQLRTKVPEVPPRPRRVGSGAADDAEINRLRAALRQHPCHGCSDREEHARWGERYHRLTRENDALQRRVANSTHTISRTFDRVCALLEALGYLDGDTVADDGRLLARLYTESDLLAAECIRTGVWDSLAPADLAACASALVFEARSSDDDDAPRLPTGQVREALAQMVRLWGRLTELEAEHSLSFIREPDLGFAWTVHRWASGQRLSAVLSDADITAGDFVRWMKQVMDLLGQIADAAEDPALHATAHRAIDAINRGVVAYSSVA